MELWKNYIRQEETVQKGQQNVTLKTPLTLQRINAAMDDILQHSYNQLEIWSEAYVFASNIV